MNILFLNNSTANPITGGIQCVAYYLYKYFVSQGHHVVMLAWVKTVDDGNHDFVYMPDSNKQLSKANKCFLEELLDSNHIDIVLNHTCLEPYKSIVLKFIFNKGLTVVNIFHNSPFGMYGIRKYRKFLNIKSTLVKQIIDKTIRLGFYIKYGYLLHMQAKYCNKVVLLSDHFKKEYTFFAGRKYAYKLISIPNPLTVENVNLADKQNRILYVGRLSAQKGLNYLLEIWNQIEDKYPDWSLDIVGDGEEKANAENKIQQLGLKRCKLYGFQQPDPFYTRSKIFCMTSLFEGFGLVLIEAMNYKTVPLAFDSYPNVKDIIDNGKNGLLIPPFDVDHYANALSLLMDNPNLLEAMADEAKMKSKEYDLEIIGSRWEKLFEELLKK